MERVAAMGVPAGGGRNELDCRLRNELDHVGLLRQRLGPPLWQGYIGHERADLTAGIPRFCGDADLLVHPVLDVPPQDLVTALSSGKVDLARGGRGGLLLRDCCEDAADGNDSSDQPRLRDLNE